MGIPGYTKGPNSYNTINLGTWTKSYGPLNNAQIWDAAGTYLLDSSWGTTKSQIQTTLKGKLQAGNTKFILKAFGGVE
jgi:hypothetical protein